MEIEQLKINSEALETELNWFSSLLKRRFELYFQEDRKDMDLFELVPPPAPDEHSMYSSMIRYYQMGPLERMIMILALTPYIRPEALDVFFTKNAKFDRGFTEFGGIKGDHHGGFLPTGETASFLGAGRNLTVRFYVQQILGERHFFRRHNILRLESAPEGEPELSGLLMPMAEFRHRIYYGTEPEPVFNHRFPAKKIEVKQEWDELILDPRIIDQLEELVAWLEHQQTILEDWQLGRNIKPGYRSLFFGPPGTGKTLAAGLLGKRSGYSVYRVDLSQIVSKYIGETEKNLSGIFDRAEHEKWILFFDEADALFGQRTQTKSSNDRHSNQEISYLLQRIEDYNGVVILATNLKDNIDEAFARRFQSSIYFPVPDEEQRSRLWRKMFNGIVPVADDVNPAELASKYTLSGGAMINVIRYSALKAVRWGNGKGKITQADLIEGIRRELKKDGKTLI